MFKRILKIVLLNLKNEDSLESERRYDTGGTETCQVSYEGTVLGAASAAGQWTF